MSDTFQDPMGAVGDAASTAYQNALNEGLQPEQAFDAAATAATAAGQEAGIPAEALETAISSAQEAFSSALSAGEDPSAAFEAAGDAVQETMGDPAGDGGPMAGGDGGLGALDSAIGGDGGEALFTTPHLSSDSAPGGPEGFGMDTEANFTGEGNAELASDALSSALDGAEAQGGAPIEQVAQEEPVVQDGAENINFEDQQDDNDFNDVG